MNLKWIVTDRFLDCEIMNINLITLLGKDRHNCRNSDFQQMKTCSSTEKSCHFMQNTLKPHQSTF